MLGEVLRTTMEEAYQEARRMKRHWDNPQGSTLRGRERYTHPNPGYVSGERHEQRYDGYRAWTVGLRVRQRKIPT